MIGRTIGRYKVTAKLGEGGMGSVWRAEDTLLGREIALKFLPHSLNHDSKARKRFLREARSASALNHPGIATVYDTGEADGQAYIAFELVNGASLRERIAERRPSIDEAVRMVGDVCRALAHAHSKRILHRDVKSGNIMVNDEGAVVVVDFGVARLEGATDMTDTGMVVGTPAYMAPEVYRGERADARSDLYSLGVVLYELLAGRVPFVAEHQAALAHLVVNADPAPPSEHNPDVPPELDAVVLKLLAKDPDDRYQRADELEHDTDAFAAGNLTLTSTMTVTRRMRMRRSVRRIMRPRFLVPVAAALALLTVLVLWKTERLSLTPTSSTPSIAVLPLENLSDDPADSDWIVEGIGDRLATNLTQVGLRVKPWVTSRRFTDLSRPMTTMARELGAEVLVVGRVRMVGTGIDVSIALVDGESGDQLWVYEFREPNADVFEIQRTVAFEVAQRLKGRISEPEREYLAKDPSQSAEAYELYLKGSLAMQGNTREDNNRALALFEKAIELDPELDEAYVGIGAVQLNRFFFGWEAGARNLKLAKTNFLRAIELEPGSTKARGGLIRAYSEEGLELACLQQARVLRDADDDVESLLVSGQGYLFGGLADKAVLRFARALELDPANEGARWFLVLAHAWAARFEESITAGEAYINRFGEDAEILLWIGYSYHSLGDYDVAALYYDRAIDLFGDDSNLYVYELAGLLYKKVGDMDKVEEAYLRGLEEASQKLTFFTDNHRVRLYVGIYGGRLGDEEALRRVEEQTLTEGRAAQLVELALVRFDLGEPERGVVLLREAVARGGSVLYYLIYSRHVYGLEKYEKRPDYASVYAELEAYDEELRARY